MLFRLVAMIADFYPMRRFGGSQSATQRSSPPSTHRRKSPDGAPPNALSSGKPRNPRVAESPAFRYNGAEIEEAIPGPAARASPSSAR
jgi:hypothetical protein